MSITFSRGRSPETFQSSGPPSSSSSSTSRPRRRSASPSRRRSCSGRIRWLSRRQESGKALAMAHYEKPDWLTKHVFNPFVMLLTNRGLSVRGSRFLVVRGRKSGQIRTTPVNPLEIGGKRYLVAPRGETEWERNLRAARGGELRLGRQHEPIGV